MSSYSMRTESGSESEHDFDNVKVKPSTSKAKPSLKRGVEKTIDKKTNKKKSTKINTSYRDNVGERLRSEDYDEEIVNSISFRQGDGLVTIKNLFEDKPSDYWVLTHYKCSNIENIAVKDRWKHSEASVKLYTSETSKNPTLSNSLNETMQAIFDTMLQDPTRRTVKSKLTV